MTFALLIPVLVSLLVYFLPAYLQRRNGYSKPNQYFVSVTGADESLFQNSSVAYALQMATFGPFFVWGVTGDFFAAILNSFFFCIGLFLIYAFRNPMQVFLKSSLAASESITIHQFIARAHGNDHRVKFVASIMTILALLGLVLAELFGLLTVVQPFFGLKTDVTYTFIVAVFFLMFLYSTIGGNDGVMHSDQLQLGFAYVGLFIASASLILGCLVDKSGQMPDVAFGGTLLLIICGVSLILLRRFIFLRPTCSKSDGLTPTRKFFEKALFTLEHLLNAAIVAAIFATVIFGIWKVAHSGISDWKFVAKLVKEHSVFMMVALCVLPLFYQLVDITNWQRIAALELDGDKKKALVISKPLRNYALEAPTAWIVLLAFGGLASIVLPTTLTENVVGQFVTSIIKSDSIYSKITLISFMVSVFAIALSTMDAVFSAALCAFRYDILPIINPSIAAKEKAAIQWSSAFGMASYFLVVISLYFAEQHLAFGRDAYLAILLAFYSGQLAFVPLILGPLVLRYYDRNERAVGGLAATCILILGCVVGVVAVINGLRLPAGARMWSFSSDDWMWASVSASLFVSTALYFVAVIVHQVNLGRRVRKAIQSDAKLIATSKNIRVSTTKGQIILHGSVSSEADKDQIEAKARTIAGSNNVKNQLTVKVNDEESSNEEI